MTTNPLNDACYVPVDRQQRVNHTYGLMMIKRPPRAPWVLDLAWPVIVWFTEGIFREDREIVELEQAAYDAQGEDWNNEIFAVIRGLKAVLAGNGTRIGTPPGGSRRAGVPCGNAASHCGAAYGRGRV